MKKKARNILLITLGIFTGIILYARHNFENDKQSFLELKSTAGAGDIKSTIDKMEELDGYANPIINILYYKWKNKIYSRFVTNNEVIENTSGNKIVNDISNIYRTYWNSQLLKENPETRTDSILYENVANYLISNKLTPLNKDSLLKIIKSDVELISLLEAEGYHTKFLLRNGFQDLVIWDEETTNNYTVILPKDTIQTTVIFIENYHLNGYDGYATFGSSTIGGWAIKDSATLYCNKAEYDLSSEEFEVSYLKHESIHFTDLNDYPNLSSADLEYRAKVIELMHCTKKTIYDRMSQFINGADSTNRKHSHPYANYCLIKNLSRLVFDGESEMDYKKWLEIPVESINKAATTLYYNSEKTLLKDKNLEEII